MLYCPKCEAKYDDGTQRFCTNEGARLLPLLAEKSGEKPIGVFTSILGKSFSPPTQGKLELSLPDTRIEDVDESCRSAFEPPGESKFFQLDLAADEDDKIVVEEEAALPAAVETEYKRFQPLPLASIINPSKIPEKHSRTKGQFFKGGSISESSAETERESSKSDLLEIEPNAVHAPSEMTEFSSLEQLSMIEPIEKSSLETDFLDFDLDEFASGEPRSARSVQQFELDLAEARVPQESGESNLDFELNLTEIEEINVLGDRAAPIELNLVDSGVAIASGGTALPGIEIDLEEIGAANGLVSESSRSSGVAESGPKPVKEHKMVTAPIDAIELKTAPDLTFESGYAEENGPNWYLPVIIGFVILCLGAAGLMYLINPKERVAVSPANIAPANIAPNLSSGNVQIAESNANIQIVETPIESPRETAAPGVDSPPPPRPVKQPPNTVFYKNKKSDQKGELLKQFLGFSIFYPKDWKENKADNKFLDISRSTPDGFPIEQFLISPYVSQGTYSQDLELFDDLIARSNKDLKAILTNYQVISEGETTIQNGRWKAYEIKFQGLASGKKVILWGRRLWIPVQRQGMKSGFIITMVATSLAKDVKSVDDIGVKGDLATILNTFEPDLN